MFAFIFFRNEIRSLLGRVTKIHNFEFSPASNMERDLKKQEELISAAPMPDSLSFVVQNISAVDFANKAFNVLERELRITVNKDLAIRIGNRSFVLDGYAERGLSKYIFEVKMFKSERVTGIDLHRAISQIEEYGQALAEYNRNVKFSAAIIRKVLIIPASTRVEGNTADIIVLRFDAERMIFVNLEEAFRLF